MAGVQPQAVAAAALDRRGERFPFVLGRLEKGKTPKGEPLNLQPGELVRVKSKREIVATLDKMNRNRGLSFDHEMAQLLRHAPPACSRA